MFNPIQQERHQHFSQILRRLNASQWEAVRQIDGPVMAIAGPGTGKTHMLTARIGHILLQTDAQAHNILCLTFTEAGVQAMRERLTEFIGAEAHRVHIFTFHSFCNKIIQENADMFGQRRLQPLSELERIEIVREILLNRSIRHPLRRTHASPYFYEQHLTHLMQTMKKEGWSVQQVQEKCAEYLESLPTRADFIYQRNGKTYQKGELKQDKIDEATQRMERLSAAAALLTDYRATLEEKGRYDFEDMILWVIEAFEAHEHLLRRYQEQYLYVLIDEFQDTNGAQKQLVDLLLSYWEDNPNIFVVGDDDQAIYEFQGARLQNTLDFFHRYAERMVLVQLQENYRSTQPILDAAKLLIDQNKIRLISQIGVLSDGKQLFAVAPHALTEAMDTHLRIYPNQLQEEIDIVRRIEQLKEAGCPLHEIAIIFARHKQARNLVRLLEKQGISYQTKRRIDIFQLPIMLNLRQMMRFFAAELAEPYSGEHLLFEILHYEYFAILPSDLALLSKEFSARRAKGEAVHWLDLLRDGALLSTLGLRSGEQITEFVEFVDLLLSRRATLTLPEWVEQLFNRSGLLRHVLDSEQKAWHLEVLYTFLDFVQREGERRADADVQELLDIWQKMEDNRLELGLQKNDFSEQGVQLLTAHSAKGLEFRHVFVINCLADFWEPVSEHRVHQFPLPDTLSFSDDTDALEASRRLFYVAMTRAKQGLYLSYYQRSSDERVQQCSRFVDELLQYESQLRIRREYVTLPSQAVQAAQTTLLMRLSGRSVLPFEVSADHLRALLKGFQFSASALNAYLYCPLSFYYEYLLRIPHTTSYEALFGTALHDALKRLFDHAARQGGSLPPMEQLMTYAQEALNLQPIAQEQKSYYRQWINQQLPAYYESRVEEWTQQLQYQAVYTERYFRQIEVDGVPMTGIIDKMRLVKPSPQHSPFWLISDYKTGKTSSERLAAPSANNPNGGAYWRQLMFYKLLVEQANISPYPVLQAEIDYLTPNYKGHFEQKQIEITTEGTHFFRQLLRSTYDKIMLLDFSNACGQRGCKWCAFTQRIQPIDSFSHPEVESMDE